MARDRHSEHGRPRIIFSEKYSLIYLHRIIPGRTRIRESSGIRRRGVSYHAGHHNGWAVLGGAVEVGESPADAAIREAREEIGANVRLTRLLDVLGGRLSRALLQATGHL
jgi:8-oxo-dGTP pyrophosphatase MutT (NUDIX family)